MEFSLRHCVLLQFTSSARFSWQCDGVMTCFQQRCNIKQCGLLARAAGGPSEAPRLMSRRDLALPTRRKTACHLAAGRLSRSGAHSLAWGPIRCSRGPETHTAHVPGPADSAGGEKQRKYNGSGGGSDINYIFLTSRGVGDADCLLLHLLPRIPPHISAP